MIHVELESGVTAHLKNRDKGSSVPVNPWQQGRERVITNQEGGGRALYRLAKAQKLATVNKAPA
jgi:hypothetical protein